MGGNMDREQAIRYIREEYGAEPERLWERWPQYGVFRHASNRKWFAVVMGVPRERLGLPGLGDADILNVKADPDAVPMLCQRAGILPAYHMSKEHWVSVVLDGSVPGAEIERLLEDSYRLTK